MNKDNELIFEAYVAANVLPSTEYEYKSYKIQILHSKESKENYFCAYINAEPIKELVGPTIDYVKKLAEKYVDSSIDSDKMIQKMSNVDPQGSNGPAEELIGAP